VPKLVFDVRANHATGVSRYGLSLLTTAAPLLVDGGWHLTVVAREGQRDRARGAIAGLDRHAEVRVPPSDDGFVRRSTWLRELIRTSDLYYTSHYTLDRSCPAPFVFTIHDLTRLRWPDLSYTDATFAEQFGTSELRLIRKELAALAPWHDHEVGAENTFTRYFAALNRYLAARAERVITVSRSTAHDLEHHLRLPSTRIDIVPGGVDTHVFRPRPHPEVTAIRRRLGITGPFLVFVGLAHPNKRFSWLVEQLLAVRDRVPASAQLVAVGGYAERVAGIRRRLADADAADFVLFTGRITDAELAALYTGASGLVSASISEGNGLRHRKHSAAVARPSSLTSPRCAKPSATRDTATRPMPQTVWPRSPQPR
jgi:glycosyltransferase involved in cell wall biosynthesis